MDHDWTCHWTMIGSTIGLTLDHYLDSHWINHWTTIWTPLGTNTGQPWNQYGSSNWYTIGHSTNHYLTYQLWEWRSELYIPYVDRRVLVLCYGYMIIEQGAGAMAPCDH